jgi:hypothetical protein
MKSLLPLVLCMTLCFGAPGALAQSGMCDESTAFESMGDDEGPAATLRADQIIYKGVVGNLLEAVPLDADQRVGLQRTNAVISNPMSARSLALLLGVTNPLVMVGGLIWGIWAASRIERGPDTKRTAASSAEPSPMVAAAGGD